MTLGTPQAATAEVEAKGRILRQQNLPRLTALLSRASRELACRPTSNFMDQSSSFPGIPASASSAMFSSRGSRQTEVNPLPSECSFRHLLNLDGGDQEERQVYHLFPS